MTIKIRIFHVMIHANNINFLISATYICGIICLLSA